MNIGNLIYHLPEQLKRLIRNIEKTSRKVINAKLAIGFNRKCLIENLLPKYTDIRTHDPAVRRQDFTVRYRKRLIEHQIEQKQLLLQQLVPEQQRLISAFDQSTLGADRKEEINTELRNILNQAEDSAKLRTLRKLNKLYRGRVNIPEDKDGYVNLSNYILTDEEKEVLDLGLNCHLQPRYDKLNKKIEIELLYQSLLKLQEDNKVTIDPNLQEHLRAESTKHRNRNKSTLLSAPLKNAAKSLKENKDITIRRADKSSIYVILETEDYLRKLDIILEDQTKFKCIAKDPTESLKRNVNGLIERANAAVGEIHFPKIIGQYSPGYIYGNVKIHKQGFPLRPIISQVPTPTYDIAKRVNNIISKYIPSEYSLKSNDDLLDILRATRPNGLLASLDVESLFTNVPVEQTIEIILQHVYNHSTLEPPKIPKAILKGILQACTMEAPFITPRGDVYYQIEGVAMGSPLGPTFANFYMGHLESNVLQNVDIRPTVYARYVDDIFVVVRDEDHLKSLKEAMENNSELRFTYELSVNDKIPFLDINIDANTDRYITTVYSKPTDVGRCLNAASECPERYKNSVIKSYLRRAYKISSTWQHFHQEIERVKQLLINNNFCNRNVDKEISAFLTRNLSNIQHQETPNNINIFYKNQMHNNHKTDEKVIKRIMQQNVKCTDTSNNLKLIVYYKNKKVSNSIMKNSPSSNSDKLKSSNVVYEYKCITGDCALQNHSSYIGMTRTTLSRRLTCHLQQGAIKRHHVETHETNISRQQLVDNTSVLTHCPGGKHLEVTEAVYIREKSPSINIQYASLGGILKLFTPTLGS